MDKYYENKKEKQKIISTTVDLEMYDSIKKQGMKFADLIRSGFSARGDFQKIRQRIRELEAKCERLATKLSEINIKNWKLEEKIAELGGKIQ